MGILTGRDCDAWYRAASGSKNDLAAKKAGASTGCIGWLLASLIFAFGPAEADTIRIATYAAPLSRDGPGLLLRDIWKGEDSQIAAVQSVIGGAAPDVLILTNFDFDKDGVALAAFAALFDAAYPHHFAAKPNSGMVTPFDLDRNGRDGEPRDAMGYGRFAGDGGLAILSRYPVGLVRDLSATKWRDLPENVMPVGYFLEEEQAVLRLSSTAHWIVPIEAPSGPINVMAFGATPPVFDGPEDRNGLRNRDELRLWEAVLNGMFGPPPDDFVIAGNANLDPQAGQGFNDAMATFLADTRLQDPLPGQPNADWSESGVGKLRVSYVLPAASWTVTAAGTYEPSADDPLFSGDRLAAGPHHLVWVDIRR